MYSSIIIFFTGFISRYIILVYLDVNVFTEIFNIVSLGFFGLMSVYIGFVRVVISEMGFHTVLCYNPPAGSASGGNNPSGAGRGSGSATGRHAISISDIINPTNTEPHSRANNPPAASNPPAAGGVNPTGASNPPAAGGVNPTGANNPAAASNPPAAGDANNPFADRDPNSKGLRGALKSGRDNGHMLIDDPNNQKHEYKPQGPNQPYLGNMGDVIDDVRKKGNNNFSRYMFAPHQKKYFLDFLKHKHPDIYDEFFSGQYGRTNEPL